MIHFNCTVSVPVCQIIQRDWISEIEGPVTAYWDICAFTACRVNVYISPSDSATLTRTLDVVASAFHLLYIEKKSQNSRSFAT